MAVKNKTQGPAKDQTLPKQSVRAALKFVIPLSTFMSIMATLAFTGIPESIWGPEAPLFTTTRLPVTGEHILNFRVRTAPSWAYQMLHALPAIVWCALIPLQHSDRFRQRWPALHRRNGYVVLTGSLILSMTGYYMLAKRHAHTHDNFFHLHTLSGLVPIGWPTFSFMLSGLAPIYLGSLYATARTARAKDFAAHRKWAVLHTMSAYIITFERLSVVIIYAGGWVLNYFPKEKVYNFFRVDDTLESKAEAELDAFAFVNVMAFAFFLWWAGHEFRKTEIFGLLLGGSSKAAVKQE